MIGGWKKLRSAVERIAASAEQLGAFAQGIDREESRVGKRVARMDFQLKFQLDNIEVALARIEHMLALSDPRFASPLRLERYGRRVMSQNDEDGIVLEIFRRIGEGGRVFAEIAAGDGEENCTALLLAHGWSGLWVECDPKNVDAIRTRRAAEIAEGRLKFSADYVKTGTVNDLIRTHAGEEIDFLVIDIDGNDYYLVEALELRPRVLCIEYLSKYPPPVRFIMPRDDEDGAIGHPGRETSASLQAYEDLLTPRGYSLVGTSLAGVNCFFVRSDLVEGKFEAPFTAYNHYNGPRYWYKNLALQAALWRGPADGAAPKR